MRKTGAGESDREQGVQGWEQRGESWNPEVKQPLEIISERKQKRKAENGLASFPVRHKNQGL